MIDDRYDPRIYKGAHTRALLRMADGELPLDHLDADFVRGLADDIRTAAIRNRELVSLCTARRDKLMALGEDPIYLPYCCGIQITTGY